MISIPISLELEIPDQMIEDNCIPTHPAGRFALPKISARYAGVHIWPLLASGEGEGGELIDRYVYIK